jgi:hypothetical protein
MNEAMALQASSIASWAINLPRPWTFSRLPCGGFIYVLQVPLPF